MNKILENLAKTENKSTHVIWHQEKVTKRHREEMNRHKGFTIWLTGLSAAGKSTLAFAVEEELYKRGCRTFVLDGDNVRHSLNKNLGFSPQDRAENIRRISEVASLFNEAGIITLTAFISPYKIGRDGAKEIIGLDSFIEVYVDCPLDVCEQRDPKGIYKKARAGFVKDFTGVDAPYEVPENPDIHIYSAESSVEESVEVIINYLEEKGFVNR